MAYTVASYHDIGHHIDAKNHETISAKIMYEVEKLKHFFSDEELLIIKEAIEDHRASADTCPRSIYGKIVSSADRNNTVNQCLVRSYFYGRKLDPNAVIKNCMKGRMLFYKEVLPLFICDNVHSNDNVKRFVVA